MRNISVDKVSVFVLFFLSFSYQIQGKQKMQEVPSGLRQSQFSYFWQVEADNSQPYKLTHLHDTLEITTRGGFTLWRKQKLSGDIEISYFACVMDERHEGDRLSDLNCFWMATDPIFPKNIFKRGKWRNGVFEKYYSLQMYYLGYGGNSNSTTRFRKYDGNWAAFSEKNARPEILSEYTDSTHLLKPNHWYYIRIVSKGNRIQYYMDNELLVDFEDKQPLRSGWFGFRTTWARVRITNFQTKNLSPK
jgi:Domain of unknown function (DUF6250)